MAVPLRFPADLPDETPFFRAAVAKFLHENHLADLSFEELCPSDQSKIIQDAQRFKSFHEGADRE